MQADVERAEVSAVVARGHAQDRRARGGRAHADRRGTLDGLEAEAVDHDLVGTSGVRRHLGRHHAAEGRGKCRVRAGTKSLVLAADLGPGARDPPGKGQDHVPALAADGGDGRLGGLERGGRLRTHDDEVAAGHPFDRPERLLAEELAVHHRDPPVPPAADPLRDLPAVAEVAQPAADADRLLAERAARCSRPSSGRSSRTGRRGWPGPSPAHRG